MTEEPMQAAIASAFALLGRDPQRVERPVLKDGILEFDVERHGAVSLGGTNATVQSYRFDVKTEALELVGERRRQLYEHSSSFTKQDAEVMALELHEAMEKGLPHLAIKVLKSGERRIIWGAPFKGDYAQTKAGRRQRLKAAYDAITMTGAVAQVSTDKVVGLIPQRQEDE